jgi:hypothetical protein
MHQLGVQFGLSRGLLQLRGEEVLLSQQLIDAISVEAQHHVQLGRPPIQGNFLVDMTIRAAQDALQTQHQGRQEEMVPFFTSLNQTMYYTFCRIAERAGVARKEPTRLMTNSEFWSEFSERAADIQIKRGKSMRKLQKALFNGCHGLVKEWYARNDPENIRHVDLIALFMFNFWNSIGLLPMTQKTLILASLAGDQKP